MYLFDLFGISSLFALYRSQSFPQFVIPFVLPFFNIPQQMASSGKYSTRYTRENNRALPKTRYRKQPTSTPTYYFTGDEFAEAAL